jgi:hypothetical protein
MKYSNIITLEQFKEFMKDVDSADRWDDFETEEWESACEFAGLNYHDYDDPDLLFYDLQKVLENCRKYRNSKRYNLYENSGEVTLEKVHEGCTVDMVEYDPVLIKSFEVSSDEDPYLFEVSPDEDPYDASAKEEALDELKKYSSSVREFREHGTNKRLFDVTEYYIEEDYYDFDGEWCGGGDIWDFTPMKFEVISEPNKEVLAVFDNLADAEHFMNYEIDYNDDLQNARIELQETIEAEKDKPSLNTDISDRYGQEDVNEMTFHHHK